MNTGCKSLKIFPVAAKDMTSREQVGRAFITAWMGKNDGTVDIVGSAMAMSMTSGQA